MDEQTPDDGFTTGRLRMVVRFLDIFAKDLSKGTDAEQGAATLIGYCAAVIANGDAAAGCMELERLATWKPRADHARLDAMAAQAAADSLDLPDSYTGIGG